MNWKHLLLPHPETHNKAHLISIKGFLVYIALFIVLQFSFNLLAIYKPGVLGVNSNVNAQELIKLTNDTRQKNGLPPLAENPMLAQAALEKGKNMFEEDYWAHYSPSGKDPWGFILKSGYKYTYAGENLAKNFVNSPEVIEAWMASQTHKENILNAKYQDIGIAVLEGVLNGQKTTLVVQEFGTPTYIPIAQAPVQEVPIQVDQIRVQEPQTQVLIPTIAGEQNSLQSPVLINPYYIIKSLGLILVLIVFGLILLDIYIMKKRSVVKLSARNIPHLALLSVCASTVLTMRSGSIL